MRATKCVDTLCALMPPPPHHWWHVVTLLGCSILRLDRYEVEDCRKEEWRAQQRVQGPIQIPNRSSLPSRLKNRMDFSVTQSNAAGS
ncbi:hypothetical protein Q5P01_019055 [Channa striata]|uniref:Uncharacterized protein n=1 Tax=Channa striata TaxID=64152 RepID=A0AA88M0C0_CHASR|nr:hypothetical protein Q5P01_019055 [Channa striata]